MFYRRSRSPVIYPLRRETRAAFIHRSLDRAIYLAPHFAFAFVSRFARRRKVVPRVNSEAHITREVTYPRQQGRPPAVPAADAALVVSLFATLIMESPLARGPCGFGRRTRLRCYRLRSGLAAGRARATKLGEQPIRAYSARQK